MDNLLNSLRNRRVAIQARSDHERTRAAPDSLRLYGLKKLKLRCRDQIEFIQRMNSRGETVPIPVIRRRSFRPALSAEA